MPLRLLGKLQRGYQHLKRLKDSVFSETKTLLYGPEILVRRCLTDKNDNSRAYVRVRQLARMMQLLTGWTMVRFDWTITSRRM